MDVSGVQVGSVGFSAITFLAALADRAAFSAFAADEDFLSEQAQKESEIATRIAMYRA